MGSPYLVFLLQLGQRWAWEMTRRLDRGGGGYLLLEEKPSCIRSGPTAVPHAPTHL
jgi:hypothetical protein